MKITIIFWSGTGNTEEMAKYISEGASSTGAEVECIQVSQADSNSIENCDILVFGCPSMGEEILEEEEFEPYIRTVETKLSSKKIALFGSYDWGDCQWMRDWSDRMKGANAVLLCDGLTVNLTPEGDDINLCKDFGKKLASFA